MANQKFTSNYRGFTGEYEYLRLDEQFHGRLILSGDLVTFSGLGCSDIEIAFMDAVDDYIEINRKLHEKDTEK